MKYILSAISAMMILFAGCGPKAFVKENVHIKTLFSPNEVTEYILNIDKKITIYKGDTVDNYGMRYQIKIGEMVNDVSNDFITLELAIENAEGSVLKNNQTIMNDIMEKLKGHSIFVKLTYGGDVVDIEGTDLIPTLTNTKAEQIGDREIFAFLYDYFKPGEFKPGAIYWKYTKTGKKVFRYEGIDKTNQAGDAALLTFKGTLNATSSGYEGTVNYERTTTGSYTGNIYHLLQDARVLKGNEKFNIEDVTKFPIFPGKRRKVTVYTELNVKRASFE